MVYNEVKNMRRRKFPINYKLSKNIQLRMLFSFICLLTLTMGVGYAYLTTNLSVDGTATIEPPPVLRSWDYSSAGDFHNSAYKENIVKASFVNYIDLTKAVTLTNGTGANYWDLSENQNGSVLGWIEPDKEDSTKYQLYIGTNSIPLNANKDSSYIFNQFTNLKEIQFQNFNTGNVTNMRWMFASCSSLTNLDLSNFNTSNVTDMASMFRMCQSLLSLNLSSFDTSNVTGMGFMFYNCSSLTTLDLSSFDMSKVADTLMMLTATNEITSAYARTAADAAILNSDNYKPDTYSFVVKA